MIFYLNTFCFNLDFELLEILANKFKGKIHISLGMTKINEIDKIVEFFIKKKNRIAHKYCSLFVTSTLKVLKTLILDVLDKQNF